MSQVQGGYGYQDDEAEISTGGQAGVFGLNQKVAKLTKWEYTTHGGKGGTEGEALDIVFSIDGSERGYRVFPITKAFLPNNAGETTDVNNTAMIQAFKDQNAALTHILHCFVAKDALIRALSVPNVNFKAFCEITRSLLPANFAELDLDIFLEYQWAIRGEATKTYLQIPRKMKSGKWVCRAVRPMDAAGVNTGTWEEVRTPGYNASTAIALSYQDQQGNVHPFTRNGYFLDSKFANQQTEDGAGSAGANMSPTMAPTMAPTTAMPAATAPAPGASVPPPATGGW